jgi:hypothetical protein
MLAVAIAVRFLLEMILLHVLAIWGFQQADNFALRLLAGLAAPLAAAFLWGLFISPNRRVELGRIPRLVLELALFAVAGGALWQMHWPVAGLLLFAAACVGRFGLIWLRRRELARRYAARLNEY